MDYDLELGKAVKEINKRSAKLVCIQLPDGLKQKATEIYDTLRKETGASILIWGETCFGACDVPELQDVELLIQWGHSEWKNM